MQYPRIKAHLRPVVTGDQVFLLTETDAHLVSGSASRAVLPLLDGTNTVADIAATLAGSYPAAAVVTAVSKYARTGMLSEGAPVPAAATTAYLDANGIDAVAAAALLADRTVRVLPLGGADPADIAEALRGSGIRVTCVDGGAGGDAGRGGDGDAGKRADADADGGAGAGANGRATPDDPYLTVVVVDDYLEPELAAWNADAVATGRRWLLVKPAGYWTFVGPLFEPAETACWECLRQRMDCNRMVEQYLRQFGGASEQAILSVASLPATRQLAAGMAAAQVFRLVTTGRAPQIAGRIVSVDHRMLAVDHHEVVRLPQCPVCGDPKVMAVRPEIALADQPVAFTADGGFRTVAPQATFRRLSRHISRISGAVSWLEPLITDDAGLSYSYSAGHNFAMVRNNITVLRKNLRGNSGGKGRSDVQAKVSGICEAVERFSGVWTPDRPTLRCRADRLDERHLMPNELMLFADEQYAHRREINADPHNLLHRVPEPFDPALEIDWTAAWSLSSHEPVQVPSAYVWFGHPDCTEHFFTYSDGNGNAAGNTLEEAILQGLFELVERDAVGVWWYNRLPRPAVDLDSFDEPYIGELLDYYAGMGRELWMLDLTTDIGIPTFASISRRIDHPVQDIILAFGSHVDPRLAALRALTETNQFLPAVHGRDPDGTTVYLEEDPATLDWWRSATVESQPWLLPTASRDARRRDDYPIPPGRSVADYVRWCVAATGRAGHEVLAVDQSRPDIELRVAKVMAPGLRHFWRRLGPGRLYDLPVRMGDLDAPLGIDQLNPISVFF